MGYRRQTSAWNPRRILQQLFDREMRFELLEAIYDQGTKELNVEAVESMFARALNFRKATLEKLNKQRRFELFYMALSSNRMAPVLEDLLMHYLLSRKRGLMARCLDLWKIKHNDGMIETEKNPPPKAQQINEAYQTAKGEGIYSPRELLVYFAAAGFYMESWTAVIWPVVDQLRVSLPLEEDLTSQTQQLNELEQQGHTSIQSAKDGGEVLTLLDRLLIKATIESLSCEQGALSKEQMLDLVDEFTQLNSSRHKSYFHRGFLYTLINQSVNEEFSEKNHSREAWLLTGRLVALQRKEEYPTIVKEYKKHNIFYNRVISENAEYSDLAGKAIFAALDKEGETEEAVACLTPEVLARIGPDLMSTFLERASNLLRKKLPAQAKRYISQIDSALSIMGDTTAEQVFEDAFFHELARRRALCLRAEGLFDEAERRFQSCASSESGDCFSEVYADIGLAKGGFRYLNDVLVPENQSGSETMRKKLQQGLQFFTNALKRRGNTTNAAYCLGVMHLLAEEYEEARELLSQAYSGASEMRDRYRAADVLSKVELYFALSIFITLDDTHFNLATDLFARVLESGEYKRMPMWLIEKAMEVIELANSVSFRLIELMQKHHPSQLERHIHSRQLIEKSPEIRKYLEQFRISETRPIMQRWHDHQALLGYYLKHEQIEDARNVLDGMEGLACSNSSMLDPYFGFLHNAENYDPAWNETDVLQSKKTLYVRNGLAEEAASCLERLFWISRHEDDDFESKDIIEAIRDLGMEQYINGSMQEFEQSFDASIEGVDRNQVQEYLNKNQVSILFVGGNEIQSKYDDNIINHFKVTHSNIHLYMIHPGWSSNWIDTYEHVEKCLDEHDFMVMMRFMRTNLGRKLRELAGRRDKLWFPCTGHGQQYIIRAVERALEKYVLFQSGEKEGVGNSV